MYFKINLSDKIKQTCPEFRAGIICATVTNSQENLLLWEEITNECELLKQSFSLEQINQRPPILATRNAYKRTGKDPNRYRPSAEALTRRGRFPRPLYAWRFLQGQKRVHITARRSPSQCIPACGRWRPNASRFLNRLCIFGFRA